MTGEEYLQEFGPDCELSSESFRAAKFVATPVAGIAHWEDIWSRCYVVDWLIRLHEEGCDLNYYAVFKYGRSLAVAALRMVGSWDAALLAAGLDPATERLHPPGTQWTPELVLERLREFEAAKRERPGLELPDGLRFAVRRHFGTLETACRAAGLQLSDISSRAIYAGRQVTDLVEAVRRLENLKGLERRRRLDEICHKSEDAQRIIKFHFGSLRKLAIRHGIDPRVVADTIYRDEADVQHDLDMLERAGMTLSYRNLRQGHRLLYGVMRANGWGVERLRNPPRDPKWYPRHNPRSELLPDRMIAFRRTLRITRKTAAAMAGISVPAWRRAENGVSRPTGATRERILKLLGEHPSTR